MARSETELEQLALEHPIMSLAKQHLEELSQDPATARLARERADALKLYEMDLVASRAQGHAEGEARGELRGELRGRAEALQKQLALRFGASSEAARARVESATIEQLDCWAERVLTEATLDDVLA